MIFLPLYNASIGGIKLNIKNIDFEKAEKIIREIEGQDIVDEKNQVIKCPQCGSKNLYSGFKSMKGIKGIISAVISFAFMVLPIYYRTVYKCKDCGFEFKNENK
jgi:DNA-directed RNA polymerase subunit RPC12/RpoP